MNELAKAGYEVAWTKGELIVTKDKERLPVEVSSGTPALPNEVRLKLIDEIESSKGAKVKPLKTETAQEEFELKNIWPQLSNVIKGF